MTGTRSPAQALTCAVICLLVIGCVSPITRLGSTFDGSAHWAWNIAKNEVTSFAPDAKLYVVGGARVDIHGRLPANTGIWSFFAWSANLQKKLRVSIDHEGNVKTVEEEDSDTPPGRGFPIPSGWVNSTVIFQAAWPHVNDSPQEVSILLFNFSDVPADPGKAVWALHYSNPGGSHVVTWDGLYVNTP